MAVTNPYMTLAEVQQRFEDFTFDGSSKPTSTQVTEFILLISDKMEEKFRSCGIDTDTIVSGKDKLLVFICGLGVLSMIYRTIDVADDKEVRYWDLFIKEIKDICDSPSILANETNVKNSIVGTYPTRETPFTRFTDNW